MRLEIDSIEGVLQFLNDCPPSTNKKTRYGLDSRDSVIFFSTTTKRKKNKRKKEKKERRKRKEKKKTKKKKRQSERRERKEMRYRTLVRHGLSVIFCFRLKNQKRVPNTDTTLSPSFGVVFGWRSELFNIISRLVSGVVTQDRNFPFSAISVIFFLAKKVWCLLWRNRHHTALSFSFLSFSSSPKKKYSFEMGGPKEGRVQFERNGKTFFFGFFYFSLFLHKKPVCFLLFFSFPFYFSKKRLSHPWAERF